MSATRRKGLTGAATANWGGDGCAVGALLKTRLGHSSALSQYGSTRHFVVKPMGEVNTGSATTPSRPPAPAYANCASNTNISRHPRLQGELPRRLPT